MLYPCWICLKNCAADDQIIVNGFWTAKFSHLRSKLLDEIQVGFCGAKALLFTELKREISNSFNWPLALRDLIVKLKYIVKQYMNLYMNLYEFISIYILIISNRTAIKISLWIEQRKNVRRVKWLIISPGPKEVRQRKCVNMERLWN